AAPDGSVTPQVVEYYRARAAGGAGLVIVEITFTDRLGSRAFHAQIGAHDDTMIPGLGELAAAIREEGALAGLQLGHCGPQRVVAEPPVVAPSPIPWTQGKRVPHELTLGEIGALVDDHREAGRRLAQAGVDIIHVSAGTYRVMEQRIPPMYLPEAPFARYARPIREAAGVPVIASGTIHDPQLAERLVRDGDADFVSMARPMFADPRLAEKIISNAVEDIRPCIRCNTCLAREQSGLRGYCAVNPRTGREHRVPPLPARKKAVAVIGAGPAGIEAALTAASRGHSVTLHERTGRIGGQLA